MSHEEPKPGSIPDEDLEEIADDSAGFEAYTQFGEVPIKNDSPILFQDPLE